MSKITEFKNLLLCIFGSFIYCIGFNFFIKCSNLYSGGFIGISQLLSLLTNGTKLENYNVQGIIYFLMNVPLFIIGFKKLGKKFIGKSVVIIISESIFLSILPQHPQLIEDTLTNCILGGCIEGIGSALTFLGFGSGGGTDILGLLLSKKIKNLTVGKISFVINAIVYIICGCLFSFEIAAYSFIASIFCSILVDKLHQQNNNVSVNIFSKKYKEISDFILTDINRDATIINSTGAYSNKDRQLVISIMSEYELKILEKRVKEIDKDAFIFIHPNISVMGNYEKRLSK